MTAYWGIAAHSAYDMFSWYKYLSVIILVFPTPRFMEREFLSDHCLLVPFYYGPDIKLLILVGWGRSFLSVAWPTGVQLVFFFCSGASKLFGAQGSPSSGSLLNLRVLVFDST